MSLPRPPKETIDYLPNGKTVCYAHKLRVCGKCTLDFSWEDEYDDSSDEGEPEFDPTRSDDENERVFILAGETARFIPQWDEQVVSPANTYKIKTEYKKSHKDLPTPLPLSDLKTFHCEPCQLTWLIGEIGESAAKSHPSHHTYSHQYCGTSRSLLVFVDGACSSNGLSGARAGLGVFFARNSKYNLSEILPLTETAATNQKAELAAAARALEIVRLKIMPERITMVKNSAGGENPRAVKDVKGLRLVVVTDSSYVVEGMCSHMEKWKENNEGILVNEAKKAVVNSDGFLRLRAEVEKLSFVGVQVVYYRVRREENSQADDLAKASIQ